MIDLGLHIVDMPCCRWRRGFWHVFARGKLTGAECIHCKATWKVVRR